jgi:cytidylate kinase
LPNTRHNQVLTENQAVTVACFASTTVQIRNYLEKIRSPTATGKQCMVEAFTIAIVAFSAGSAIGWLLRSALARAGRQFRNLKAAREDAEIEALEEIRRSLDVAELTQPPAEIGEGPLTSPVPPENLSP